MTEGIKKLQAGLARWAEERCCAVPLAEENPECVWHGYRSLECAVAGLLPLVHTVETRAMSHALRFFRDGAMKDMATKVVNIQNDPVEDDPNAVQVLSSLLDKLNGLIGSVER